jgi:hypothetical protein
LLGIVATLLLKAQRLAAQIHGRSDRRRPIRFSVFELDPAAGELRKHGVLLKLQEKPLQALLALLEHPGEAREGQLGAGHFGLSRKKDAVLIWRTIANRVFNSA